MTHCFHCGETVPEHIHLTATIEGREQPMCCIGCQAVAQFLASNDHAVFYRYRQDQLPGEQVQSTSDEQWQFLDAPEVFDSLTRPLEGGLRQVTIKVEGMYCSACGWLLQKVLLNLPGIDDLQINAVTQNLQLSFDPQAIRLSEVFSQISALGYQPRQHQQLGSAADDDRKSQLKRIAVAGFGMMFIMTLAVPLYSPDQFRGGATHPALFPDDQHVDCHRGVFLFRPGVHQQRHPGSEKPPSGHGCAGGVVHFTGLLRQHLSEFQTTGSCVF